MIVERWADPIGVDRVKIGRGCQLRAGRGSPAVFRLLIDRRVRIEEDHFGHKCGPAVEIQTVSDFAELLLPGVSDRIERIVEINSKPRRLPVDVQAWRDRRHEIRFLFARRIEARVRGERFKCRDRWLDQPFLRYRGPTAQMAGSESGESEAMAKVATFTATDRR